MSADPAPRQIIDFSVESPESVYRQLVLVVQPRPIALVSTLDAAGVPNLAPFSFFMVGGANPASLMISPVLGADGSEKDTLKNIRETHEFVVHLVHREMAQGMNEASAALPRHQDEWPRTGFQSVPSHRVRPRTVQQSAVALECRLYTIIEHGDGPVAARYVVGEVLAMTTQETIIEPIARLGGNDYLDVASGDRFQLDRPKKQG